MLNTKARALKATEILIAVITVIQNNDWSVTRPAGFTYGTAGEFFRVIMEDLLRTET